jgi:hypothetical protein
MTTTKHLRLRARPYAPETKPAVDDSDPWVAACRALERGDAAEVERLMAKQNARALFVHQLKRRARGKKGT